VLPLEDMRDLVGCVLPIAAHPPELPLRQRLKKAEAEIAQIEEQQATWREPLQKIKHIHSTILMHRLTPFQTQPSLGAQVKETYQFAGKASRILCAQATQRLQIAAQGIEPGFIETEDLGSKGSELC